MQVRMKRTIRALPRQKLFQSQSSTTGQPKRLYRDENDKVFGGVCSGLANYFGIDVVVMRIIFVILAVSFDSALYPT